MNSEFIRMTSPGVLGFYTHYEVTEIFAQKNNGMPFNVLTVVVLEERNDQTEQEPLIINKERIKVSGLQGWNFGVKRYSKLIANLLPALEKLRDGNLWQESGDNLQIGKLEAVLPVFVSPEATTSSPLNRVLKNNFWNGSYVFEWFDQNKSSLMFFLDDPKKLKELSDQVNQYVPVGLASLSDRLGSLLVQVPVKILMTQFGRLKDNKHYLKVAWHPKAPPRPLRFNCENRSDQTCRGYMSAAVQEPQAILDIPHSKGMSRGIVWDEENQLILADTGETGFVDTISINTHISADEPRTFTVTDQTGGSQSTRISITSQPIQSMVGEPEGKTSDHWARLRVYEEEQNKLILEKRFIQYKPSQGEDENKRAMDDVRWLINRYGESSAWLWDPYLSANDVLNTLFFCSYSGADLRALTSAKETPDGTTSGKASFVTEQRNSIEGCKGNTQGLRLEYRAKVGSDGWGFHDRFLIFPKTAERAALVWSLGTSVNSLGKEHHILQQVSHPQLIVDAFEELWCQLDKPEHLIWKAP